MEYLVPVQSAEYEQEIKHSRFIARSHHIDSAKAAKEWFARIEDEFPDARHVCWAYIAGAPGNSAQGMSDAGEPSGTAGKPIMNVLQHSGAGEIAIVVVRYFGGIKLGAGGLVRAYSSSAAEVLKRTMLQPKVAFQTLDFSLAFKDEHVLRHLLEQFDGAVDHVEYQEQIIISASLPENRVGSLLAKLPHNIKRIESNE